MKTVITTVFILVSMFAHSQRKDTIYSAKSINVGRTVHAYVLQTTTSSDTTYKRIERRDELPTELVKSKIESYPKSLLKGREVYQSHLRSNLKR